MYFIETKDDQFVNLGKIGIITYIKRKSDYLITCFYVGNPAPSSFVVNEQEYLRLVDHMRKHK